MRCQSRLRCIVTITTRVPTSTKQRETVITTRESLFWRVSETKSAVESGSVPETQHENDGFGRNQRNRSGLNGCQWSGRQRAVGRSIDVCSWIVLHYYYYLKKKRKKKKKIEISFLKRKKRERKKRKRLRSHFQKEKKKKPKNEIVFEHHPS